MINGMWRKSQLDIRVKRGADIDCDHHLVTVQISNLNSEAQWGGVHQKKKFDADNKTRNEFTITFLDILKTWESGNSLLSIDEKWTKISKIYVESCEKRLGHRQMQKSKDWITHSLEPGQ